MASQPRPESVGGTDGFSLAAVVAGARAGTELAATGVAGGRLGDVRLGDVWWIVVDPARHPLTVWEGVPNRSRIEGLGPAVAMNGPMMGRRVAGRKVTREVLVLVPVVAGATVGGVAARRSRAGTGIVAGSVAAAATVGALLACWVPCGLVRNEAGVDDRRDFDGEGPDHAWIGRTADAAGALEIGDGGLPETIVEGCGGLVRLVRDGEICTDGDAARLATRRSVAAVGTVPAAGPGEDAVVLVVGSASLDVADAATLMHAAGARDAIASDPSGCAFLAMGSEIVVGPPRWARRRIQRYGLAFGAR